jgi:hypothetical protein
MFRWSVVEYPGMPDIQIRDSLSYWHSCTPLQRCLDSTIQHKPTDVT